MQAKLNRGKESKMHNRDNMYNRQKMQHTITVHGKS